MDYYSIPPLLTESHGAARSPVTSCLIGKIAYHAGGGPIM